MTEKQKNTAHINRGTRQNPFISTLITLFVMLIIHMIITSVNGGSILQSWLNILRNNVYSGIIALGMCFAILSGGIDISVGSMLCALGAILMYLIDPSIGLLAAFGLQGTPAFVIAIIITLIAGCVLGGINGFVISYAEVTPFIATLGTMKIFRSVTQQLTKSFNPTVPEEFRLISSARIGGEIILPIIYWVVLAALSYLLFKKTVFGRQVVAIGSNEEAAKLSGINVKKKKFLVYCIVGLDCAIAAILYVSRIGSMDFANAGSGYEMDAIAAVTVGGVAMTGGKGSLAGAFIGMLIIGIMNNMLNMVGVPTFLCEAIKGAIILISVIMQKNSGKVAGSIKKIRG